MTRQSRGAPDSPGHPALSRRAFMARSAAGVSAALLSSACQASKPVERPSEQPEYVPARIDWQQARGQELTLALVSHPWAAAIAPLLPRFTALTGIKVNLRMTPESEYNATLPVALAAASSTPDLLMIINMGQAITSRWLEPLDAYYADPKLTDLGWYDEADIFPSARDFPVWPADKLRYAVAITAEANVLMMRKDLLEAKELTPPKTFDELHKAAVALKAEGRAGIAMRDKATADAVWPEVSFIFAHGGEVINEQGVVVFDSPEATAAVERYTGLLREAGPKSASSYQWYEVLSSVMQGTAAMASDSSNFAPDIADPGKSKVAGKILYSALPGEANNPFKRAIWHWMLGMNARSERKAAAWLFLTWATSKPTSALIGRGRAAAARTSTWQDKDFQRIFGEQAATISLDHLRAADSSAVKRIWFNPKVTEVCDALAGAINQVLLSGADARSTLAAAARLINNKG